MVVSSSSVRHAHVHVTQPINKLYSRISNHPSIYIWRKFATMTHNYIHIYIYIHQLKDALLTWNIYVSKCFKNCKTPHPHANIHTCIMTHNYVTAQITWRSVNLCGLFVINSPTGDAPRHSSKRYVATTALVQYQGPFNTITPIAQHVGGGL